MAYETKDMSGSLFPSRKDNEKQPDKNGSIMIEGKMYYLSVWNRVSKDGKPYESIAVKTQAEYDKYKKQPTQESAQPQQQTYQAPAQQQYQQPVEEKQEEYNWDRPVDNSLPF